VNQTFLARTALIVDEDFAFVWWLGELLLEAGYHSVPALSCDQALSFVRMMKLDLELLIVNPELFAASRMIKVLGAKHPGLKVAHIRGGSLEAPGEAQTAPTLERPSGWKPFTRVQWTKVVRRLLRQLETEALV
jgi:hypothetical protein